MAVNIYPKPDSVTDDMLLDAVTYASDSAPKEICGVFTYSSGFVPLTNASENPEQYFFMEEADRLFANSDDVIAVVHSHPNASCYPSWSDILSQYATDMLWCIISVNGEKNNFTNFIFFRSDGCEVE